MDCSDLGLGIGKEGEGEGLGMMPFPFTCLYLRDPSFIKSYTVFFFATKKLEIGERSTPLKLVTVLTFAAATELI